MSKQQHYCDQPGCLATFPCQLHPKHPKFELKVVSKEIHPRKQRFDKITFVDVLPLPCGHNFALPDDIKAGQRKKFEISCEDCTNRYSVEMIPDVIEFVRID